MEFGSYSEKAAYLLGLVKGMDDQNEVTELIADLLVDLARQADETNERLTTAEEDIDTLYDVIFESDDEETSDEDSEDEDEDAYCTECPTCGKEIIFSEEEMDKGSIVCPYCAAVIELISEDEEE
ncbi:MAG: hypothetical protein IJ149_04030 [Oscillospiraceae bacterium]|nr:hypothetical protein [Oscillospiraceae bacterium]